MGDHRCFETHREIYLGGELDDGTYRGLEGLWVTTDTPDDPDEHKYWNNESFVNTKGGVQPLQCRWNDSAAQFGCWLYDTDNPEGYVDNSSSSGVRTGDNRSSPYSAPFVSFTHSNKRFAVFPESFAGGSVTWFKHVPVDKLVRGYSGTSWHEDDYDIDGGTDDVLRVQDTTRVLSTDPETVYEWVDVAASDFKTAMRRRYP